MDAAEVLKTSPTSFFRQFRRRTDLHHGSEEKEGDGRLTNLLIYPL